MNVPLTTASAYVDKEPHRRTVDNSHKKESAIHSQGTPGVALLEITTIVNFIGATNFGIEGTLAAFYAAETHTAIRPITFQTKQLR